MVDALSPLGRRELDAWLSQHLADDPTSAERRAAELGALAQMLNELTPAAGWRYPMIEQTEYDRLRPQGAPSGRLLSERHGSWQRACKAAYGLKGDGRTLGRSHHAWPHHPGRGRPRIPEYTLEEVIRAVRRCALELACRPTSTTYMRWQRAKCRLARERGVDIRIPNIYAIYRHFRAGNRQGWRRAVAAAALSDEELRSAYARRMRIEKVELTAADELDEPTIDALNTAGISQASIELLQEDRAGDIPLSQAVVAARVLGCSLAFLARTTTERGRPPAGLQRFDHETYRYRRVDLGVPSERIRSALGLGPRNGRRLALGTFEPTLAQVTLVEQLLQLPTGSLIAEQRRAARRGPNRRTR